MLYEVSGKCDSEFRDKFDSQKTFPSVHCFSTFEPMIMEAKRNIVFSAAVWVAYVLVFAVQKPFFLFYNRDVWSEMSAFDWGQAFVSGLLFD